MEAILSNSQGVVDTLASVIMAQGIRVNKLAILGVVEGEKVK